MAEAAQNVVDHPRKDSAGPAMPGIVTEYHIKVSDGQNLQFSTALEMDAPLAAWNAALDKMRRAGERQRLIGELAQFERTIILNKRDLATSERRFTVAEVEHQQNGAKRAGKIDALREGLTTEKANDLSDWGNSGKRGNYTESAKLSSRLNSIEAQIRRIEEEQESADADRENAFKSQRAELNSVETNIAWFENEIAMAQSRLAALED